MSNLVEWGHGFYNFFERGHLQKSLGNPAQKILKLLARLIINIYKIKTS